KEKPLAVPSTRRLPPAAAARVHAAADDASTSAFHLGVLIAGLLMIAGGAVSGFGIVNPRRSFEAVPAGGAAAAGECGHGADCDCGEGQRIAAAREPSAPELA
ncbi:MAG: hypothetical protein WBM00_04980, partial [Solirubrobacterales bacterium]